MTDPGTTAPTDAGQEPAQPVTPETPPAPAAGEGTEPQAPLTRGAARRGLQLDQAQRQAKADAVAALEDEREAEPAPEGEPTEQTPAAGEPTAEGEPTTEPEPGAEPIEGEPEPEPEGPVTVELDPRHPGTQGLSQIQVKDEREARMIRTLVLGYARRQDVEAAKQQAAQMENLMMRERDWRLRQEAVANVQAQFRSTEDYKAAVEEYDRIHQEIGPEAAERHWQGVTAKLAEQSSADYQARVQAEIQADADRRGDYWANQMWQRANTLSPDITQLPQFHDVFMGALRAFDAEIVSGTKRDVTAENLDDQFQRYFNARLLADPAVTATITARRAAQQRQQQDSAVKAEQERRDREAADQAAVERWKKEQAAKREQTPPHPLGNLGATRERETPGVTPAASEDTAGWSAHQVRRAARRELRKDVVKRFGGQT